MIEPLLEKQLDPVVRRHRCWRRWRGWILGWGGVALVGLGFIGLKHLFGIGAAVVAPVLVLAALVVTVAVWFRNAAWSPDYREIARRIERQHPELHALLLTAVEQRPNPATGRLDYLQQRVVDEAIAQSARHQWLDAVPAFRIWALRGAWLTVAAGFGAVLWSLWTAPAGPGLRASLFRGTAVTVQPGDAEVERGSGVIITARFEGAVPGEVTLVIGTGSNELQRLPMVKSLDDPVFGGSLTEVSSNLTYRVAYAGTQSEDFHLRVFEHPSLKRADAHLEFPDYTGLAKKTIENTRRVSAVEGSQLELVMELNKPVVSARLVGKDKSVVPLVVETNKPQVALRDFALTASQTYELHLVDADGRTNKVPAQFVLEALKNRKPELKFLAPRGDQKVSPIEEMNFQGEAWDDFGLRGYGLAYTVAGSETVELRLGTNAAPGEKKTFGHLLSLETLKLVPDQLISYYLWAEDVGPDGQLRRSASDMFFAEVRALDEIFREGPGQQSEGEEQQGGGNQATRLAELQKEIINATWKLQRQETGAEPSASYKEDARVVADSQEQALAQAEAMQSMTQDPRAQVLLESVTEAMDKALKHLVSAIQSTASLPPALQAEQAAYQALLKLSQHEYLVSRSRSRGRQGQAGQNQGQLDQLDLKQSEDRYETQSQAAPQQSAEQR
ncbi:MAG TPA: hypothetical protein VNO52_03795, partial [Methylomirabilota bacterium]|nr:hypothetical protein [Methylomirabilota bacterium]